MKSIDVAVGVVYRNRHFFICKRNAEQHQGNKWEFPGGKVEPQESAEQALKRELHEEIAISVNSTSPLTKISFDYPEKTVRLHVFLVEDFDGEAKGAEGQQSKWVPAADLIHFDFPDANQAILDELKNRYLL